MKFLDLSLPLSYPTRLLMHERGLGLHQNRYEVEGVNGFSVELYGVNIRKMEHS